MTSTTFFIIFIPILAILLLAINLLLAPHNPYQEKDSAFECGFHSFLGQNRTQFSISFFIFGLLFLLFDLEILLVYPYSVSSYTNDIYGLVVMMVFFVLLTLGFIFELGKNALTIDSRQTSYNIGNLFTPHAYLSISNPLYHLITSYDSFATLGIPSASQMAHNRTPSQIAQYANALHSDSLQQKETIVAQAQQELASATAPQVINELNSVVTNVASTYHHTVVQIAEAAQLAFELVS